MDAVRWLSVDSLINELRDRSDYAILCGSGISRDAGLPTGQDFRDLVLQYAPDLKAEGLLRDLLTRSAETLPPLRFEGILEVLQRTVDHELETLKVYREGTHICIHRALAKIACLHPVLTTNFDVLIERAGVATGSLCPGGEDGWFTLRLRITHIQRATSVVYGSYTAPSAVGQKGRSAIFKPPR